MGSRSSGPSARRGEAGRPVLGALLAEQAKRQRRTVSDVVRTAGVSRATWYLIQTGASAPSLMTATRLLSALDITFEVAAPGADHDLCVEIDGRWHELRLGEEARATRERAIDALALTARVALPAVTPAGMAVAWLTGRNIGRLAQRLSGPDGGAFGRLLEAALQLSPSQVEQLATAAERERARSRPADERSPHG